MKRPSYREHQQSSRSEKVAAASVVYSKSYLRFLGHASMVNLEESTIINEVVGVLKPFDTKTEEMSYRSAR